MLGAFLFGYAYPRAASTIDAAEINLITLYRDQRVLAQTSNELVKEEIINLEIQLWIERLTQTARGVLDSRESLFNTLFLSRFVVFLIGLTVPRLPVIGFFWSLFFVIKPYLPKPRPQGSLA